MTARAWDSTTLHCRATQELACRAEYSMGEDSTDDNRRRFADSPTTSSVRGA